MKMIKTLCWAVALACLPLAVHAESKIEVGRVKVVLAEDGWTGVEVPSQDIGIEHGVSGMVRGVTKVLTLPGPDGAPLATLLLYTTWGTAMGLRASSECPPEPDWYVRDYSKGRQTFPECLRVAGPFSFVPPIPRGLQRMSMAREAVDFDAPDGQAFVVVANFSLSNASTVVIEALISQNVAGLPSVKPVASVPDAIPPGIAAWADALGTAALAALNKMSGEMRVPALMAPSGEVTPK